MCACDFKSAGALTAADLTSVSTEGVHSGTWKWSGITAVGEKVYAAPCNAPSVLVLTTATDAVYNVSTEGVHSGDRYKWDGITAVGDKVYAAPCYAPSVPWPGLQHWSALDPVLEGRTGGTLFELALDIFGQSSASHCSNLYSYRLGIPGNLGFFRDNRFL